MFDGWFRRHKVDRLLRADEKSSRLSRTESSEFTAIDKGLIAVNSTYFEYADRFFLLRGWGVLSGVPFLIIAFVSLTIIWFAATGMYQAEYPAIFQQNAVLLAVGVVFLPFALLMIRITTLRDAFSYTYNPIRFNRVDRKVYVYNGDHKGGVLTIPWANAFFSLDVAVRWAAETRSGPTICDATCWMTAKWFAILSPLATTAETVRQKCYNIGK